MQAASAAGQRHTLHGHAFLSLTAMLLSSLVALDVMASVVARLAVACHSPQPT